MTTSTEPVWPTVSDLPDPSFVAMACAWMQSPAEQLLGFVWTAYDDMRARPPLVDGRDLERSITQLLDHRIRQAMTGYEPFYIQHSPHERETMLAPPAQPPTYDLAFVLLADERIMWPLEAKILETPGALAEYERDVREQFLTCRYAPFSSSGAMLGYLLSGTVAEALERIAAKLVCTLVPVSNFPARPHRTSRHLRSVPTGKAYPAYFECHHLVLDYAGLQRQPSVEPKTLSVATPVVAAKKSRRRSEGNLP